MIRYCSNKHTLSCLGTIRPTTAGSLAGLSFPAVYVGVVDCATASLSPASSSLTHTRRMDGFCNQNADQLGSLAGLSFPAVYVGFPMSAHLSRLRLRHSPSTPFTQYPSPSRSLVRDGQTSPHKPRLVVPNSTCPSLSPSPPAHSFITGPAVIHTHTTNDAWDQPLWETLVCTTLGLEVPVLASLPRRNQRASALCGCKKHGMDLYGDHTSTFTAH